MPNERYYMNSDDTTDSGIDAQALSESVKGTDTTTATDTGTAANTDMVTNTGTDTDTGTACPCCNRRKERSEKERRELINRLNRIEGQIRGIKGMLERDAYCTDIITQVIAASSALDSFNRLLLANHIHTCVVDDIKADKEETVDELIALLHKMMR